MFPGLVPTTVQPAPGPASAPFAPVAPDPALYGGPIAAREAPWPAAGTYQPHPGTYLPSNANPNPVLGQDLVPVMPGGRRELSIPGAIPSLIPTAIPTATTAHSTRARSTFAPTTNSRPDLQWYRSASLRPSRSTYTGGLVMIVLTPLLMAGGYALLLQVRSLNVGLAPSLAVALLLLVLFFVGIGAAQVDRNALAQRGYFDLASPFWILLSPLVYLGVRASRLRPQGSGGVRMLLLWILASAAGAAIVAVSTLAAITAVTLP